MFLAFKINFQYIVGMLKALYIYLHFINILFKSE